MPSLNIHLPEPAYSEAARAAADRGLSVEAYVADFVQMGMGEEDGYAPLTTRQLEIIAQAEADIDAGRFLTMPQVRERLAANKAAWLQTQPR